MLKKIVVRGFMFACVSLSLSAIACDSSGKSSNGNGTAAPADSDSSAASSSTGSGSHGAPASTAKATVKTEAVSPLRKVVTGRWVDDAAGGFSWHFAAANFVVTSEDKDDLTRFPKEMQGKVASFYGDWEVTPTEIVLTNISGPGQQLIKEVRISYKPIDGKKIEIDGKTFSRSEVKPAEPPANGA
ncbi:MAG: hypothetical protein H6819_08830 [Phycisphaerales bacterium]|nr:hypothetical protein [Phycisphaerales bacterium]MCB9855667.1 hypothetical protein [Phycisphaerales bacterium]MCB9862562.1 hypothetical protein [Phycisphaerales bacterium]